MIVYVARRLLETLPVLVGVSVVVFLILRLIPGDPAIVLLGERATPQSVQRLRDQLGLNQPWPVQYGRFVQGVLRGDLGSSARTNRPVLDEARARFPATVELTVAALFLACLFGVGAGIVSASFRGSMADHGSRLLSLAGVSIPIFWLGLVLIWVFAVQLRWLPPDGRLGAEVRYTPVTNFLLVDAVILRRPDLAADALRHLVLPAVALCTVPMAIIARMTRSSMLEVLQADYVRTARAKGLRERAVTWGHAFKNASLPIVTVVGLQVGILLSGAILTETIFAWPGIGRWIYESILNRDYPVVQGMALLIASIFVVVNLGVDILYAALDPRLTVR